MSPGLVNRNQSRFQFAHSVDPVKKDGTGTTFKFGFGVPATVSDLDKDEILVPARV